MGLFSFVGDAGEKLAVATEDATKKSENLKEIINNAGFKVENLDIVFDGKTVTVTGMAEDNDTREKVIIMSGNTFGVESVDDQMEVKGENISNSEVHTVVSGDTLGKIAKKYYGNASKYTEIFEANKPMLKNADSIYVGQVLRIPKL